MIASASTACSPTPRCAGRSPAGASRCSRIRPRSPRISRTRSMRWPRSGDLHLTAAFGPQHGLRGDKQDNMIESPDFHDPRARHSGLQPVRRGAPSDGGDDGHVRRAAGRPAGPRLPHLHLHHHAALRARSGGASTASRSGCSTGRTPSAARSKAWRCARAGRASSAPARCRCATASRMGELGSLVRRTFKLDVDYRVDRDGGLAARRARPATAGRSASAPGSIRVPTRRISRWRAATPGTVMLEGTTLSEGRGTTRPLELFGAPDIDAAALLDRDARASRRDGCAAAACASCWFEPTFHKHAGKLCNGAADPCRRRRLRARRVPPVARAGARVQGAAPPATRTTRCGAISPTSTSTNGWRSTSSTAATLLREWVDDAAATPADLDALADARRARVARGARGGRCFIVEA